MSASLRKSVTDLTRRKARASFTVLTLALAVASIGIFAVPAVMQQAMDREVAVNRLADVTVTMKPLPLLSVYTASKAAVNAFTESLALELEPFGIDVKIVLPGAAPATSFGKTAISRMEGPGGFPEAYAGYANEVFGEMRQRTEVTLPMDVAQAVWRAVSDPSSPMRLPAGADAVALANSQA